MTGIFSGPKPPAQLIAPPAPTVTDPSVQAAAEEQRVAQAQAAGRASTVAIGGQGDTTTPTLGRKMLLGG